ncbi:MAG: class 1b ribonucleoside-diphosphate reductase subunit alpha, partial [Aquiluna sp.]
MVETKGVASALSYQDLNAMINLWGNDQKLQLEMDKLAVRKYFLEHVNQNTVFFHSLKERLDYLVENEYYEKEILDRYSFEFITKLNDLAYSKKFRFEAFMGAFKFYTGYALKTFDGQRYLERFEDRVVMVALTLAEGVEETAISLVEEIISGRFQPATPTFLNCGKKQRGEFVSCFLLRIEDNMESISRGINSALQLSKRGGGVALSLSNIREYGAPIKKIEGQSSGIIPVMKLLEDSFSYANQLGARQGAGAVYLNAHHPDIMRFLDTKRENADEKIRIKTLSIGVVLPDITMMLAKDNEDMYLFSPYDVEKVYGVPFGDISVTEKYYEMVDDPRIRKSKIKARDLLQKIAELQFESGYPYVMYEDTVNNANPVQGRINMSNLCSEILQVNTPTTYNADLSYDQIGKDISCNLGSLNIAMTMDGPDFGMTIETAIRGLTAVSDQSNIESVRSVSDGNHKSHAIGLGQMNLHGYLAREQIH